MTHPISSIAALSLIALSACSDTSNTAPTLQTASDISSLETIKQDKHRSHAEDESSAKFGFAAGIVQSINTSQNHIVIKHNDFQGDLGMKGMTMGFDVLHSVDLANVAAGDRIAFRVEQNSDGALHVLAICYLDTDGGTCLHEITEP